MKSLGQILFKIEQIEFCTGPYGGKHVLTQGQGHGSPIAKKSIQLKGGPRPLVCEKSRPNLPDSLREIGNRIFALYFSMGFFKN